MIVRGIGVVVWILSQDWGTIRSLLFFIAGDSLLTMPLDWPKPLRMKKENSGMGTKEPIDSSVAVVDETGGTALEIPEELTESLSAIIDLGVLSPSELESYPSLRGANEIDAIVLSCYAMGMSLSYIARAFKIGRQAIHFRLNKLDPERRFRPTKEARRAVMTRLWEMRGTEALMNITAEKMMECNAVESARIAKMCGDAVLSMNMTKHGDTKSLSLDLMMDQIADQGEEVAEGEFEVGTMEKKTTT